VLVVVVLLVVVVGFGFVELVVVVGTVVELVDDVVVFSVVVWQLSGFAASWARLADPFWIATRSSPSDSCPA
jgi:hypothetical protein